MRRPCEIKLVKPFAAFLQVLPWIWIVSNRSRSRPTRAPTTARPICAPRIAASGAFRVRRAEAGNLYEFERVANGWKQGGGNLSGAIWKIMRETATQRLMVQRGEAHIAVDLTSEDMDALKGQPGVVRVLEPEYRTFSIKMNTRHGPLADIESAQGDLLRLQLSGDARCRGLRRADDRAAAERHLRPRSVARGLPDRPRQGEGASGEVEDAERRHQARRWCTCPASISSGAGRSCMLDSLKKLNIDLDIKPMIWPDMVASCRSPETFPDFFPVYQTANYGDPDNIAFAAYHSSRNGNWQNPVYSNPKVDELIDAGRAEHDEDKRKAIYKEFQEAVVADAPDIFGVLEKRKLAMRDTVLELQVHAGGVERGRAVPAVAEVMSHRRRAACPAALLRERDTAWNRSSQSLD